jgi:hypothetical protein
MACSVVEEHNVRRTDTSLNEPSRRFHANDPPPDSPVDIATMSVLVKAGKERPRRCFVCAGEARSLAWNDPHVEGLIREFYTSGVLTRHFRRKHLSKLRDDEEIHWQVCDMQLDNQMHLQNHARRVHGTVS